MVGDRWVRETRKPLGRDEEDLQAHFEPAAFFERSREPAEKGDGVPVNTSRESFAWWSFDARGFQGEPQLSLLFFDLLFDGYFASKCDDMNQESGSSVEEVLVDA